MGLVIIILKIYMFFVIFVMLVYMVRHYFFTLNRFAYKQRLYYNDIIDSELPTVSVIVPMHNEEKVARNILERLAAASYPEEKIEVIPIKVKRYEVIAVDDHSTDKTKEIISEYAKRYPFIKPLFRDSGERGKPVALNEAIKQAKGEVILVFDADYLPPKGIIKELAICFKDPEVGAVMGRVIPVNVGKNILTRMLELERTGGYQVGQQARHNLRLIPQYGGTVGGFRKKAVVSLGGFNPNILTEDTELTFKLLQKGWKVVYANRAECYEESPEDWTVRGKQIKRWARGHTQVFLRYCFPILRSKYLSFSEKFDGTLLLGIYLIPLILLLGILDALALFFLGEMNLFSSALVFIFVAAYNSFGNFAPFYQVAIGSLIDGDTYKIRLVPLLIFNFAFNMWYITLGDIQAIIDFFVRRKPKWEKTKRYSESPKTT